MIGEPAEAPPTALISWAHDSDAGAQLPKGAAKQAADRQWLGTVLDLVTHLRTIGGVDADLDYVHGAEPVDWSRWGPEKVRSSDFVLVAVNKAWARRFTGREASNRGAGATAEADELLGIFERERDVFDRKVIMVVLPGADEADIPARLLGRVTRVWVNSFDEDGLDDLLRRIYGKPRFELPPLRPSTPPLPPTDNRVNNRKFLADRPPSRESSGSLNDERNPSTAAASSRVITALGELESRLTVVESGLRALPQEEASDDSVVPRGRERRTLAAERVAIDAELRRRKNSPDKNLRTVRFMWVEGLNEVRGYEGDVDQTVLQQGWLEPDAASLFPGPAGRFRLIPEEEWRTIDTEDPAPIFLHQSYSSRVEKWVQPISGPHEEVAAATRARDAVIALVDSRLAANPRELSVSRTVTTTERTPQGMAVVGRCVVVTPVRADRQKTATATAGPVVTVGTDAAQGPKVTVGQRNALAKALDHLRLTAFSKEGLVNQLVSEGFSADESELAVSNVGAAWDEQAAKKARDYLSHMTFSRRGLINQLVSEGFSQDESELAVSNVGADWDEQAAKKASEYLAYTSFSQSGLARQLASDGFTQSEAEAAAAQAFR